MELEYATLEDIANELGSRKGDGNCLFVFAYGETVLVGDELTSTDVKVVAKALMKIAKLIEDEETGDEDEPNEEE